MTLTLVKRHRKTDRNKLIRRMHGQGKTQSEIALTFGITRQRVLQILRAH